MNSFLERRWKWKKSFVLISKIDTFSNSNLPSFSNEKENSTTSSDVYKISKDGNAVF